MGEIMKFLTCAVLVAASLFLLHGVTTSVSAAQTPLDLSGQGQLKGVQVPFGILMAGTLIGGLLLIRRNS